MIKPLHKRIDFIASLLVPTAISAGIALSIYNSENHADLCFTAECYQAFLTLYKIPLTTLALAFPLAGIVGAYHRSIETNEQIKIAQTNNTFSNYIKHREDFLSYISEHTEREDSKLWISDMRSFYRAIFPENDYLHFDPSLPNAEENTILRKLEVLKQKMEELSSQVDITEQAMFELYELIDIANKSIGLTQHRMNTFHISFEQGSLVGPFLDVTYAPMLQVTELLTIANKIRTLTRLPSIEIPDWENNSNLRYQLDTFTKVHKI